MTSAVSVIWLYPIIIVGGLLQALGPPMNGQLRQSLVNPWLASLVSFGLIVAFFVIVVAIFPRPLPTAQGVGTMPWWAPIGGLVGAVAVIAGLLFVDQVGAGPLAAMTVSANLIMSVIIDQFGLLNMPVHALSPLRTLGVALLLGGVGLITLF